MGAVGVEAEVERAFSGTLILLLLLLTAVAVVAGAKGPVVLAVELAVVEALLLLTGMGELGPLSGYTVPL